MDIIMKKLFNVWFFVLMAFTFNACAMQRENLLSQEQIDEFKREKLQIRLNQVNRDLPTRRAEIEQRLRLRRQEEMRARDAERRRQNQAESAFGRR